MNNPNQPGYQPPASQPAQPQQNQPPQQQAQPQTQTQAQNGFYPAVPGSYQPPQSRQPLDRGNVCVVVGQYPSRDIDPQTRQPLLKNRYANVGRATQWPSENGSQAPNVQIELETMPIGVNGPQKLHIFWDSEKQAQPTGR